MHLAPPPRRWGPIFERKKKVSSAICPTISSPLARFGGCHVLEQKKTYFGAPPSPDFGRKTPSFEPLFSPCALWVVEGALENRVLCPKSAVVLENGVLAPGGIRFASFGHQNPFSVRPHPRRNPIFDPLTQRRAPFDSQNPIFELPTSNALRAPFRHPKRLFRAPQTHVGRPSGAKTPFPQNSIRAY